VSYAQTVASTWKASIQAAGSESPPADQVLALAAHLGPDAIPKSLFTTTDRSWPGERTQASGDAARALARFSLATVDDKTVSVHRLLQKADAATAVGRYSHHARTIAPCDEQEEIRALAGEASDRLARLAAAVLIELGAPIDCDTVVAEAAEFLEEVDLEEDGLQHASDALGSLLQAKLVCLEERVALPRAELHRAAVGILGPLAAQAACLRWP